MKTAFQLALVALIHLTPAVVCQTLERRTGGNDKPPARKGNDTETRAVGRYASVNGLKLYYELHPAAGVAADAAVPLILLHGGIQSTGMFDAILPELNKRRPVIAVDLQAHGRTADIDRPLRFELMADDVAALVKHLRIDKVDVLGYSLGGAVALRLAIQHPDVVRKLVDVSAPVKRSALYPEVRAREIGPQTAEAMKPTPPYKNYANIAPNPKDWPTLISKFGELARRDYDWSKEVAALKSPVLIIFGDADMASPVHAAEFFELLGGGQKDGGWDGAGKVSSQLAILPGLTHYGMFGKPALVAAVVVPFLDAAPPKPAQP
jgi:pimeloyl-ACP methyl ester carboxylesterase